MRYLKIGVIGSAVIVASCGILYLAVWLDDTGGPENSTYGIAYIFPFLVAAVLLPVFWIGVVVVWGFSTMKNPGPDADTETTITPRP